MTSPSIAIIGAGPAGLFAAELLSGAGCQVDVYERKPTAARKFLMAGRGGLNLTHSEPLPTFLTRYGSAAEWLRPYIEAFTPSDLRQWCDKLGGETFVGTSGRVFPKAMKASPVLRNWLSRLRAQGVRFHYHHDWQGWDEQGALVFNDTLKVKADATLLALGGASWPRLGADGGWTSWLEARGIAVTPFAPANCGFVVNWSPLFSERFAGQPLKPVLLSHAGQQSRGEVMVTALGVEGGGIYALSRSLREAIARDGQTTLTLDLNPNLSEAELQQRCARPRGSQSQSTWLRKTLGLSPLAANLLRETATPAERLKHVPLQLIETAGLERAISSAGGISLREVDDRFQLKKIPGVFVAGEMLDWEAPTGGYLLQATFSTAAAAAKGILAAVAR